MIDNTVVIKFGGNALTDETAKAFCHVVAQLPTLGYHPIIVHGGGPQINALLNRLKIHSHFINGLRYTDADTLAVAEMVLCGQVGKMLVRFLGNEDRYAVSISGKDGKTLIADKLTRDDNGNSIDLGYVGKINRVNPTLLMHLVQHNFIPVVAPLAYGTDGETYNINADYAAAAIAKTMAAKHFVMMTNIAGLLDANQNIIHRAGIADIHRLIADNIIDGGMIPKTLSAIDTLSAVGEVNIIDGRNPANLLTVLAQQTIGTTISKD